MIKKPFLKSSLLIGLGAASVASIVAVTATSCATSQNTTNKPEIFQNSQFVQSTTDTTKLDLMINGYKLPTTKAGWGVKTKEIGSTDSTYVELNVNKYDYKPISDSFSGTFSIDTQETINKTVSFYIKNNMLVSILINGKVGVSITDMNQELITNGSDQTVIRFTFKGSNLPSDKNKYVITNSINEPSPYLVIIDNLISSNSVTFQSNYENVYNKIYTLTVNGDVAGQISSKSFIVNRSIIDSSITSKIDQDDLEISFTGQNLSNVRNLYSIAPLTKDEDVGAPISSNLYNILVNSTHTAATIVFPKDPNIKTLYGSEYQIKTIGSEEPRNFIFGDYGSVTGIQKDVFFVNMQEGVKDALIPSNKIKIDGNNLDFTITTSSASNNAISIPLSSQNVFSFLIGQFQAYTPTQTELIWDIDEDTNLNFELFANTLTNKNPLVNTPFVIVLKGTLMDSITKVQKSFELVLRIQIPTMA